MVNSDPFFSATGSFLNTQTFFYFLIMEFVDIPSRKVDSMSNTVNQVSVNKHRAHGSCFNSIFLVYPSDFFR